LGQSDGIVGLEFTHQFAAWDDLLFHLLVTGEESVVSVQGLSLSLPEVEITSSKLQCFLII